MHTSFRRICSLGEKTFREDYFEGYNVQDNMHIGNLMNIEGWISKDNMNAEGCGEKTFHEDYFEDYNYQDNMHIENLMNIEGWISRDNFEHRGRRIVCALWFAFARAREIQGRRRASADKRLQEKRARQKRRQRKNLQDTFCQHHKVGRQGGALLLHLRKRRI